MRCEYCGKEIHYDESVSALQARYFVLNTLNNQSELGSGVILSRQYNCPSRIPPLSHPGTPFSWHEASREGIVADLKEWIQDFT